MSAAFVTVLRDLYRGTYAGLDPAARDVFVRLFFETWQREDAAIELPRGKDDAVGLAMVLGIEVRHARIALRELTHPEDPMIVLEGAGLHRYVAIRDRDRWATMPTIREMERRAEGEEERRKRLARERTARYRAKLAGEGEGAVEEAAAAPAPPRRKPSKAPPAPALEETRADVTGDARNVTGDASGAQRTEVESSDEEIREEERPSPEIEKLKEIYPPPLSLIRGEVAAPASVTPEPASVTGDAAPEVAAAPVSETRLRIARPARSPRVPAFVELFEKCVAVVLDTPVWHGAREPHQFMHAESVLGYFDKAGIEGAAVEVELLRLLRPFVEWVSGHEGRGIELKWLQKWMDQQPERRPGFRPPPLASTRPRSVFDIDPEELARREAIRAKFQAEEAERERHVETDEQKRARLEEEYWNATPERRARRARELAEKEDRAWHSQALTA